MLKVGYLAAHQADPQAVIHLAGTTWWQDALHNRLQFIERLLRIILKDPGAQANNLFFDVLTVHVYDQTELGWKMTRQLQSLPAAMGYPKPVWIDELNARPTADTEGDNGWQAASFEQPVTLDQQADFLVQAAALGLALGVQRMGVYRLYDNVADSDAADGNAAWGLIRNDGSHRPAYDAWSLVIREFSATTAAQRATKGGVSMVTMTQPDRYIVALWNQTDQPITVRVPHHPDSLLLSPFNDTPAMTPAGPGGAMDEFVLPPCIDPCAIEGEPRLLELYNALPVVYAVNAKDNSLVRVN